MLLELNKVFFMVFSRSIREMLPLDIILSAIGTAGYNIVKFFVPLLSIFTTNEFTINDSFSFVNEMVSIPDSDSYVMASFDIKSLFTNIPLDETVAIATESFFNSPNQPLNSLRNSSQNFSLQQSKILYFYLVAKIIYKLMV